MKSWGGSIGVLALAFTLQSVNSALGETAAISYCNNTGKFGMSVGATQGSAVADSIRRCIASGGVAGCCQVVAMTEQGCVSIAIPNSGRRNRVGIGRADTEDEADELAIADCGADCAAEATQCVSE